MIARAIRCVMQAAQVGAAASLAIALAVVPPGTTASAQRATSVPLPRAATIPQLRPEFYTRRDTTLNLDSPAVWHGPAGTSWLLTSAKTGDRVRIDDAATGRFITDLGSAGTGPGQLRRPNGIAVLDDVLFVVERDNARVQLFELPSRRSLGTFGAGELRRPYGITVERDSSVGYTAFVTDNFEAEDGTVPSDSLLAPRLRRYRVELRPGPLRASSTGTFGGTHGDAVVRIVESVAVDPEHDRLFVAEEQEGRSHVKVYSRAGHFRGAIPGALFPSQAEGIALYACTRGGYVVMTDQSRTANAFHVFERATLRHVGSFGLAGVSNTDGIAVTSRSFGRFAAGAMYAVDDDGRVAAVSWARIARVLGLEPRCDAGAAGLTSPRGTD